MSFFAKKTAPLLVVITKFLSIKKSLTVRRVQFQTGKGQVMEECKTLRQLHTEFGVSRRAVQGYEKAGLVKSTARNKYGHLLYDENAQMRIARIRLYQQLGFRVKEIAGLIDAPADVRNVALEAQIVQLRCEQKNIDELIAKAYELMQEM